MLDSVFTKKPVFGIENGCYNQKPLGGSNNARAPKVFIEQYCVKSYFRSDTEVTCSGALVKFVNGKCVPATGSSDADGMVYYFDPTNNANFANKKVVVANRFVNGDCVKVMPLNNNAPIDPYIFCEGAKKGDKISMVDGDLYAKVAEPGETAFAIALSDADINGVVVVRIINKEKVEE